MLSAVSCLFQLTIIKTKATTDERKEEKKKKGDRKTREWAAAKV